MREFFKGWRRKTGCVTLVMAFLTTSMWVRSSYMLDTATLAIGDFRLLFVSGSQELGMIVHMGQPISLLVFEQTNGLNMTTIWKFDEGRFDSQPLQLTSAMARLGKVFYNAPNQPAVMLMPYWVLAAPLTLLSAYLILWKPRPKVERDA